VSRILEERCHDQFRAVCADIKDIKMNLKCSAKQEDESSPQVTMMSFMVVWVSLLFMCTLDLWGSAEGVTDTTKQTIICLRLEHRTLMTKSALVSLLAAFVAVWCILILFCSGRLAYM